MCCVVRVRACVSVCVCVSVCARTRTRERVHATPILLRHIIQKAFYFIAVQESKMKKNKKMKKMKKNNQTNKKLKQQPTPQKNKKTKTHKKKHTHTIALSDFLVPVKYSPPPTNNEADKQGKKQTIAEGEPGIAVECFAVCSDLIVSQWH